MSLKKIGEFTHYDTCRFCDSETKRVLDLGYMPLAGGFMSKKEQFNKERFYPLTLAYCSTCSLLQTENVVSRHLLFDNYYYKSSSISTLVSHFKSFAKELHALFPNKIDTKVLEIGCNDGSLLQFLRNYNFRTYGVDPAKNIISSIQRNLNIYENYFSLHIARKIKKDIGSVDVICSFNTLAHIENMHDIFDGISHILKPEGILIFENQYLLHLIRNNLFDTVYHEHQYYYSTLTIQKFIKRFNMELYDVKFSSIHGGSIRFYIQLKKTGIHPISLNVSKAIENEKKNELHKIKPYIKLEKYIKNIKVELLQLMKALKKQNKIIAGYGASGRATILMNYLDLKQDDIRYVIDDSPLKQYTFTPGNHIEILPPSVLRKKDKPDYLFLFAWTFRKEIEAKNKQYKKNGGKFILPLPKVTIV